MLSKVQNSGPRTISHKRKSELPFPFPPPGESRGGRVPHAAGTLCASKKRLHTSMRRLPPQEGFQSAPLQPPCASPRWVPSGPRRDVGFDLQDREKKFKDGRHVGFDFYDLLIEVGIPEKCGRLIRRNPLRRIMRFSITTARSAR